MKSTTDPREITREKSLLEPALLRIAYRAMVGRPVVDMMMAVERAEDASMAAYLSQQ